MHHTSQATTHTKISLLTIVQLSIVLSVIATVLLSMYISSGRDASLSAQTVPIPDTNGDNKVNVQDLSYVLSKWQTSDSTADLNNDGTVNIFDLSRLLSQWQRDDGVGGLPDPITPTSNKFNEIIDDYPNGGVIVIPNGTYTAEDLNNFSPSNRLTVVAENKDQVIVVRRGSQIGQTDFTIRDSSDITFAGIHFKDIVTAVIGSDDIEFRYTQHSYPITAHPDPTETYCGSQVGPNTLEIGGSNRISLYGVDSSASGHDAVKLNRNNTINFIGSVITGSDHGGLQQGRGNSRCGWDGDDNYHNDGIQIYPGGVDNLTIEDSYVGRRMVLQVDQNGTSNNNLIINNNWFFTEAPFSSCLSLDARVKSTAQAGATMDLTMTNNTAWCTPAQNTASNATFWLAGSRHNAMTINGTPISSSDRNGSSYLPRMVGTPTIENSPAYTWRANNPYSSWLSNL